MQKCGSVSVFVFSIDTSSSRLINACFISSTEAGRGHPLQLRILVFPFWSNISTISILKQHFHSISILFPFYFHSRGLVLPFRRVLPFYSRTPLAHALGVDVSLHVVGSTYEIQKQTWVRERLFCAVPFFSEHSLVFLVTWLLHVESWSTCRKILCENNHEWGHLRPFFSLNVIWEHTLSTWVHTLYTLHAPIALKSRVNLYTGCRLSFQL